jgi:hypothetical protein
MALLLRTIKGSALTHLEVDGNFAERFASTAHGLTIGVGLKPAWSLSQADAVANVAAGIVAAIESVNAVWIATKDGTVVTWTGHGLGAAGTILYDSQTVAGTFTSTRPATGIIRPFLRVIDNNTVMIERGAMEFV